MSTEYENLAKLILSTPQGARVMERFDKIDGVLSTVKGEELLYALYNGGTEAIKSASLSALENEGSRAKSIISSLLSTQEGAKLCAVIIEILR